MNFDMIKDPSVREYMMRKQQDSAALDDSRGMQDIAGYAGIGTQLLNDFNRSKRKDVILNNRLQDLGRGPNVVKGEVNELDPNLASNIANMGVNRAKEDAAKTDKDFKDKMAIERYGRDKEEYGRKKEEMLQAKDPNSEESKQARDFLRYVAPGLGNVPGYEKMSAEKLEKIAPVLMQKYRADREAEATKNRLDIQRQIAEMKTKNKPKSQAELKQKGLAEMGAVSESQYQSAVKNPDEYDPTSYGDWIDNSNWAPNIIKSNEAIAARSAQDNWIESYLRDASGAAIPDSERNAYREIYFPVMGDSPQVVENKKKLREQKMANARISAGEQLNASEEEGQAGDKFDWEE